MEFLASSCWIKISLLLILLLSDYTRSQKVDHEKEDVKPCTYRAAVYEHTPVSDTGKTPDQILKANLGIYVKRIEEAAKEVCEYLSFKIFFGSCLYFLFLVVYLVMLKLLCY